LWIGSSRRDSDQKLAISRGFSFSEAFGEEGWWDSSGRVGLCEVENCLPTSRIPRERFFTTKKVECHNGFLSVGVLNVDLLWTRMIRCLLEIPRGSLNRWISRRLRACGSWNQSSSAGAELVVSQGELEEERIATQQA
jgi:hypothetical protein